MKLLRLAVTANLEANLDAFEAASAGGDQTVLYRTLERLEVMCLLLRRQPHLGRPYVSPSAGDEAALILDIRERLGGGEVRELVLGEYLVLYLAGARALHLLAIRHHRQNRYDFGG